MSMYWTGVKQFGAALMGIADKVDKAAFEALAEVANMLADRAKELASGRPGPEVRTGSLRRGIKVAPIERAGAWWQTRVGPTMIYSRRVELGYRGTDSLGRGYDAPAYPYFTPAYKEIMPLSYAIFVRKFSEALEL